MLLYIDIRRHSIFYYIHLRECARTLKRGTRRGVRAIRGMRRQEHGVDFLAPVFSHPVVLAQFLVGE
jgi:hypothetical protein